MVSPEHENRYIVRSVRGTLRDKMGRIKAADRNYSLTDLALSLDTIVPPSYLFALKLARTRQTVGYFVGEKGSDGDPLGSYGLAQLSNGESFEFELQKVPQPKDILMTRNDIGHTLIRHNGAPIGECRVTGFGSYLGIALEQAWELTFQGQPFAKVKREPLNLTWDAVTLVRPDGSRMSLHLRRHLHFSDFWYLRWTLIVACLRKLLSCGRSDLIVTDELRRGLNPEEELFLFAVVLMFCGKFHLENWDNWWRWL